MPRSGRISRTIQSSRFIDTGHIRVAVHDGTAILTGAVDNWSELAADTESAWKGGATWVVNDLELETDESGQNHESR